MKRGVLIIILLIAVTFMAGCAAMLPEKSKLAMAGRYEDLANYREGFQPRPSVHVLRIFKPEKLWQAVSLSR
jgi:hypothetical protein